MPKEQKLLKYKEKESLSINEKAKSLLQKKDPEFIRGLLKEY
jgi:hypothetical protein